MIIPKRHLFLTIWLSLIILINLLAAASYLLAPGKIIAVQPDLPKWYLTLFGILSALNVINAIALFKWKKWGFYGFCLIAVAASVFNVTVKLTTILPAIIVPVVSIFILYWALHVGKENKAWTRLS